MSHFGVLLAAINVTADSNEQVPANAKCASIWQLLNGSFSKSQYFVQSCERVIKEVLSFYEVPLAFHIKH